MLRGPTKATGSGASPRARGAGDVAGKVGIAPNWLDMMGSGELVFMKGEES